jgi:predicted RNA binding protein YcfA (HicA-like mRNA interferase family)
MPKVLWSSKDVEKFLKRKGFKFVRQKGSHKQYVGYVEGIKRRVTVIANQKYFAPKTIKSMIEQSGLNKEEWKKN